MSAAFPLTASVDIALADINSKRRFTSENQNSKFGNFTNDIVNISSLAREKQQNQEFIDKANSPEFGTESIRVTTTIGKSDQKTGLTEQQAIELYNEISNFL
ncbi:hypothetical protein [Flocculibacter collagenilyticus]|uniref:hypothetical protein n=1 Tax=Flocculibacter collagenilyticus TaxID=2744479 RepID=UPI0018F4FBF5|nr:hypothetical protein [Flocculibacter collagenilyticus]